MLTRSQVRKAKHQEFMELPNTPIKKKHSSKVKSATTKKGASAEMPDQSKSKETKNKTIRKALGTVTNKETSANKILTASQKSSANQDDSLPMIRHDPIKWLDLSYRGKEKQRGKLTMEMKDYIVDLIDDYDTDIPYTAIRDLLVQKFDELDSLDVTNVSRFLKSIGYQRVRMIAHKDDYLRGHINNEYFS